MTVSAGKDNNGLYYVGNTWTDIVTIAHEVGHQIGFPHDHDGSSEIAGLSCIQDQDSLVPIMHYGPSWGNADCFYDYNKTGDKNVTDCWSPCSRAWYDYYMSRHRFWCLNYDNVCLNISGTMDCFARRTTGAAFPTALAAAASAGSVDRTAGEHRHRLGLYHRLCRTPSRRRAHHVPTPKARKEDDPSFAEVDETASFAKDER